MNPTKIHLVTPLTWTAALVPLLEDGDGDLILHESGKRPVLTGDPAIFIVYVDGADVADVAAWWASSTEAGGGKSFLVVVGAGGLRYEWQLRELGAVDVVGYVWHAQRVAEIVNMRLEQQPKNDDQWPSWIHARLSGVARRVLDY